MSGLIVYTCTHMQLTLDLTAVIYAQRDNTYISICFFSMGIKPFPMKKNTELFTNLKAQCIMRIKHNV